MSDAFDLMLGVFRSPARSTTLRTRELPDDVLDVIRVAAGDEAAIAGARAGTGLDDADLHVAASLLLHNMFFFDGADSYRTLGVHPDADAAQIKRHYRWLVRWLHPDRNPDTMHTVFADRINRAWNSIRTEERRASYDDSLRASQAGAAADAPAVDTSALLREWTQHSPRPLLPGRLVRRLPKIVAAGVGLVMLSTLGLAAWLASLEPERTGGSPSVSERHVEEAEPPLPATSATRPPAPASIVPAPAPALAAAPADSGVHPLAAVRQAAASSLPAVSKAVVPIKPPVTPATHPVDARENTALPADIAIAPVATAPAAPAPVAAEPVASSLSGADLSEFIERFQHLYSADDVERFLALFNAQARGNSGDYAELAGDYRRLFAQRRQRRLSLSDLHWQVDGDIAAGNGKYEAWVGATADKPEGLTRGQIMLQLTRGKDGVHITQLRHTVNE